MISVLYWNTAGSKACTAQALSDSNEYDIIATQEPWINPELKTTYCPAKGRYHRIYYSGRAALYIHKRFAIAAWEQEGGTDWCSVHLKELNTTIWSIYSENRLGTDWNTPLTRLATREPRGSNVLVGDFNLHHPLWDSEGRCSAGANKLLQIAQRWKLSLMTPYGEPTRIRHGQRSSTIDHCWADEGAGATYRGPTELEGSDHRL